MQPQENTPKDLFDTFKSSHPFSPLSDADVARQQSRSRRRNPDMPDKIKVHYGYGAKLRIPVKQSDSLNG
jgi:hypothetical protein